MFTCKDKGDAHKGASLSVSLLGLHADVDDLPCGVCLENPRLAGRKETSEGVACAICGFRLLVNSTARERFRKFKVLQVKWYQYFAMGAKWHISLMLSGIM